MIISASRRTDIPSYYHKWLLKRLHEEFVYVRNPMNYNQVSKVSLSKEDVECIVFWTKNPWPLMQDLDLLKDYNYYFQFTLTSYGSQIERHLPPKKEIVPIFKKLASTIGKEKVIWRYDPVLLSEDIDVTHHLQSFELLASKLKSSTNKCVFSFLEGYPKIQKRIRDAGVHTPDHSESYKLAKAFSDISQSYGIELATCSETLDLSSIGIKRNKCIDDELIRNVFGFSGHPPKDANQRESCGCVKSIDIGAYSTCKHGCVYCYANHSKNIHANTDINSEILTGSIDTSTKIYNRKSEKLFSNQISLEL